MTAAFLVAAALGGCAADGVLPVTAPTPEPVVIDTPAEPVIKEPIVVAPLLPPPPKPKPAVPKKTEPKPLPVAPAPELVSVLKAGQEMPDGSTFVGRMPTGQALYVAVYDARGKFEWEEAKKFCEELVYHGRSDWTLPNEVQAEILYKNQDEGRLAGTFYNKATRDDNGFYWLLEEGEADKPHGYAMVHRFGDGLKLWAPKKNVDGYDTTARVRCARVTPFSLK